MLLNPNPNHNSSNVVSHIANAADPLFDRNKYLQIDPQRDKTSTVIHTSGTTVDSDLLLTEGVSISGTHFGLRVISTNGVVVVCADARILPSKTRKSTIVASKAVIVGEAILDKVHVDEVLGLADNCKVIIGDVAYGSAFPVSEKANWRIQRGTRRLSTREARAADMFADAVSKATPDEDGGYDAVCKAQDDAIEVANKPLARQTPSPAVHPLQVVTGASAANKDA